jgi:CheY-like chemotaxis protein
MPNGDAQYLLTRLRTTAATANIPVIVLSGLRLNEVTEQCLKREICGHPGATQILKKSQDTYELFEALKKFCGFERQSNTSIRDPSGAISPADGSEVRSALPTIFTSGH